MATEIRAVSGLPAEGRLSRIRSILTPWVRWLGVFLLFLVVAIVQTWPLILHIDSSINDSTQTPLPDIYNHIWHLHWVKQALVDLHTNPFHSDYLFYPDGENLYLTPLVMVNGIFSIPLQIATQNIFLSWNILALIFFGLSGLFTYALAYRVTANHVASILAGFIFAFAPWVMMQFTGGRWSISTTWPMPLIAIFLLRYLETHRLREAVVVGILWAVLLYNFQEFAMDTAVFLALFVLFWSIVYLRHNDKEPLLVLWRGAVTIGVVWVVVGAPMLVGAVRDVRSGDYTLPEQDELFSADLLAYLTPSPLWGPGEDPKGGAIPPHDVVGSVELSGYLGGVPLLLATIAVFSVRRHPGKVVFWGVVFVTFAALTLGPHLYVDGEKIGGIPMPYRLYEQLPVFENRRVPARMIAWGILGLSMLAAIGLDTLMSVLKRRARLLAPIAAVVAVSLVGLEYWNPPVHVSELPRPAALERIRNDSGNFTVLDAPLGRRTGWSFNGHFEGANTADYWAAIHGKRQFGGFVARTRESTLAWLRKEPGLRYLAFPFEPPQPDDLDPAAVKAVFIKYRIKYVVLHRTGPHDKELPGGYPIDTPARLDDMDRYIRQTIGLTVVESDSDLTVYHNAEVQ